MQEFSARDHKSFYRKTFAEHLAVSTGADFVYMGFFDCNNRLFIDWWVGRGNAQVPEPGPQDILQLVKKIDRVAATVAQVWRPGYDASIDLVRQPTLPDNARWDLSENCLIGIGGQMGTLVPVIVVLGGTHHAEGASGAFLGMGMSYMAQELHTLTPSSAMLRDDALEKALGMLAIHFAVVDSYGTVSYSTDLPVDWLRENGGFKIVSGRLTAQAQKTQKRLNHALQRATGLARQSSIISIETPSGRAKIAVIMPVRESSPRQALVIFEQGGADPVLRDHLLKLFGLTNSERRITHLLLEGKSLSEAAEKTNLSMSTVRSYMKGIFAKTSTRRQSELVAQFQNAVPRVKYAPSIKHEEARPGP